MVELQSVFKQLALLEPGDIEEITSCFHPVTRRTGNLLLGKHQVANRIYYVRKGYIILVAHHNEKNVVRHVAKAGEFITSIHSFLEGSPSLETLFTADDSEVLFVDKQDMMRLSKKYGVLDAFIKELIQRTLIQCQRRITDLLSLSAEEYYIKLLGEDPELVNAMPQYRLASYLGIEPESLSRIRKGLAMKAV